MTCNAAESPLWTKRVLTLMGVSHNREKHTNEKIRFLLLGYYIIFIPVASLLTQQLKFIAETKKHLRR